MKSRIYLLFSLFAHTLITFAGQNGMATMGIILYYNFFDASEVDTNLFFWPTVTTTLGYVALAVSAAVRKPNIRLLVWIFATGLLLSGSLLLFTRNTDTLNYKITLFSAVPYVLLSALGLVQMIREARK